MGFDEDWVNDAGFQEASARDRDLQAGRKRWAELDRAELQGNGDAAKRAQRAAAGSAGTRRDRGCCSWAWLWA